MAFTAASSVIVLSCVGRRAEMLASRPVTAPPLFGPCQAPSYARASSQIANPFPSFREFRVLPSHNLYTRLCDSKNWCKTYKEGVPCIEKRPDQPKRDLPSALFPNAFPMSHIAPTRQLPPRAIAIYRHIRTSPECHDAGRLVLSVLCRMEGAVHAVCRPGGIAGCASIDGPSRARYAARDTPARIRFVPLA